MKQLIVYIAPILFPFMEPSNQESIDKTTEYNALNFVVSELIHKKKLNEDDQLQYLGQEYYDELLLAKRIYTDGQVCLLTRPFYFLEDESVIADKALYKRTASLRENLIGKKKKGYTVGSIKIPADLVLKSYEGFRNENLEGSLFAIVREKLQGNDTYLVEINVTSSKFSDNYSMFTFHVYLDANKEVYDWEFSLQDEFDFYEPCLD